MGFNLNGTADIPRLIRLIEKIWPTILGVLIAFLIVIITVVYFNRTLIHISWIYAILSLIVLLPTTFLIWTIATKRWFQRTGYWIILVLVAALASGFIFYSVVYPLYVENTMCDVGYIRWWGSCLAAILIERGCYLSFFRFASRKNLCIVFLVSNRSSHEHDIKKSLEEARHRIEEIDSDIQIVIPPFGIANSICAAERYINGHFNQADAIIFARMIDSNEGSEFGYQFTKFTSRFSNRYIKVSDMMTREVDYLMTQSYKCHEWNTLNIDKDSISQTLEVAGNLRDLFLMYVSCIYLYKNKYSNAIAVADQLYTYIGTGNTGFDNLVKELMAHSYVVAEQTEEHENRDFARAHEILDECIVKLPSMKHSLSYKLALARLYYYEGNLRESKRATKDVKNTFKNSEWYWTINMAFYAICERKAKEVYTHYKRLTKITPPGLEEIEFPRRFQEKELKETSDDQYRIFLLHGIAFLSLFTDDKASTKLLKKAEIYSRLEGYIELEKVRDLIESQRGKLIFKPKKLKISNTRKDNESKCTV